MQLSVSKGSPPTAPRRNRPVTKPRPATWMERRNTVDGSRLSSPGSSDRTTSSRRQNVTLPRSSPSQLELLVVQNREHADIFMETARRIDTPRNQEQGETKEIEAGVSRLLSPGLSGRTTSSSRQNATLSSSPSQLEPLEAQNRKRGFDDLDGAMKTASRIDTQEQCEAEGMEVEEIQITDTRPLNQKLEHTPIYENTATFIEHQVNHFDVESVRRDPAIERAGSGKTSGDNAPTDQQLPSDTPQQLTQVDNYQSGDGETIDTLEENLRLQVCCMETTIKQQRQEIARQGQLLNSYQKGVRYKEQEIMESLIQTIENLNKELEDYSDNATSTKLRHESELKQLRDRLERAEKTNKELRDQLETQRNDYRLLEQSTSETENQLHSFQNPLTIKPDTIKPTTEELGVGSHGGIYCMYKYVH